MSLMSKNELNDLFDYGYKIYQNDDFFKFSIDSVLLSEFVDVKKNHHELLDMCSGNAPVPLIINKKFGNILHITGVELQKEIYDMGKSSLEYNNVTNVDFINIDVKDFAKTVNEKYDIVTCNPPYFKQNASKKVNDNEIKAVARHEIAITLEECVQCAKKVLKNKGYFYIVHRPERMIDIINILNKYDFGIKRIQMVYDGKKSDNCCIILIEAIKNGEDYVKIGAPLYLKEYQSYKKIFGR